MDFATILEPYPPQGAAASSASEAQSQATDRPPFEGTKAVKLTLEQIEEEIEWYMDQTIPREHMDFMPEGTIMKRRNEALVDLARFFALRERYTTLGKGKDGLKFTRDDTYKYLSRRLKPVNHGNKNLSEVEQKEADNKLPGNIDTEFEAAFKKWLVGKV